MPEILIVDDEPNIRRMVGALLRAEGFDVREASNGAEGVSSAVSDEPDVALIDLMMPGEFDGMGALERIRMRQPDLPIIMMSGKAELADAVRATKLGAFNFLEKPLSPESVLLAINSAMSLRQTRRTARALREELGLAGDMVGSSAPMQKVRELIGRVAPTDARILITGESGTGKELVAGAIHDASSRRDKPLIRVNCAAIPRDLVESEMFGHEKGSFTGATERRIGRFELAHTGTLFLDEIGDLSAEAQAKLLRAIESSEIQRVGGNKPIRVDVRIIAATNKNLAQAVSDGSFREDLYFRLNVIPVAIPPLRERKEDIPELIRHFSARHHRHTGRAELRWTARAMDIMIAHSWPGNVRELANIVERLAILHDYTGPEVRASDVRSVLPADPNANEPSVEAAAGGLNEMLDEMERKLINSALSEADGNVAEAARRLNTDRPNLYRRMKRLGLALAIILGSATLTTVGAAQTPDTTRTDSSKADTVRVGTSKDTLPADSTVLGEFKFGDRRRSSLAISSGKTYNRVEGLPIYLGPTFHDSIGSAQVTLSVFGIYRTANNFRWDSGNLGHRVSLRARWGEKRGLSITAATYDVVTPIENWHLQEPELGLATLFLHRDFRDYFGRHGGGIRATAFTWGDQARLTARWSKERWSSRDARRVFTIFRNGQPWRPNPVVDDGIFNVASLSFDLDTRNDESSPWAGWYVNADYEYGTHDVTNYGRGFLDLRRYNRISPKTQLNGRFVIGGWMHGDPLPMQRRLSVGGYGTIPGYDFRRENGLVDNQQCKETPVALPGHPANCDRIILMQLEYRSELNFGVADKVNSKITRPRGAANFVQPAIVAFADAGRGWLANPVLHPAIVGYPPSTTWSTGEFLTDVGLGIDLGKIGIYAAKAVSDAKEPVNFFVRLRRRL